MKTHDRAEWFKTLQDKYRLDPEYIAEGKIIDITEKIVARMEELRINRAELAARLNVSKAYITKLLRGDVNFTLKSLITLAAALDADISIDFLPHSGSRRMQKHSGMHAAEEVAPYRARRS